MGCNQVKVRPSVLDTNYCSDVDLRSQSSNKITTRRSFVVSPTVSFDLSPLDAEAFSSTVCQERQRAIDNMAYRKAIDQWRPSSIAELVKFIEDLSRHQNQIDRAWIIFYWISQNIKYDTTAYFSDQIEMQSPDIVFRSGKAVCEGYASLYAELCNRTGLECRKVNGYAKGFSFDVRQTKFDETNHAWNILTLDNGYSYFVEPTWGSGHLNGTSHQYKQELVSHYFLCRPEQMIYGHLPVDDQYQLLAHPLTLKQYLMLPHVYPKFFTLNLQIVSPVCSAKVDLVEGEAYGLVLIRTLNDKVRLSGGLRDNADKRIEGTGLVYLDREDQTLWKCQFAPPKPGRYEIVIFAKESGDQDQSFSTAVVKFAFDIDYLSCPSISYPLTWSQFFDYHLEIVKPVNSRYIDRSSSANAPFYEILVRSPDHIRVSATMKNVSNGTDVENGTLTNFNYQTNLWQCLFAPSSADVPFELTLFAKRSDEKESHCVAQLVLPSSLQDSRIKCMTFPLTYLTFQDLKCHLIEPLDGVLQSGSTVHFRCQIPGAQEVNIAVDGTLILHDGLKPDENAVFDTDIRVGQREVAVWVKFNDEHSSYQGFLKYTVH